MATEADHPVPVCEARGEQVGTFVDNIIKLSVSQLAIEKQTQNDNHNELPTVEGENFFAPHSMIEVHRETNNVIPNVSKVIEEPVEETLAEESQQNGEESNSKDGDGDKGVVPEQCSTDSSAVTPEIDGATGEAQLSISTSSDHHVTDDSSTENNVLTEKMLQETSLLREETESHTPCISEGEEVNVKVKTTDDKSTDEKPTEEDMSSNFTNKVTSEHEVLNSEKNVENSFDSAAEEVSQVNCTSTNTIITLETSDSNELQSTNDLNSSLSKEEAAVQKGETPLATSEDYRIPSENTLEDAATEKSKESSVAQVEDSQIECNEHLEEESERLPLTDVSTGCASDNVPAAMDTVGDEDKELEENEQSTRCTSVKEDVQIENPAESLHVVAENIDVSNQITDITLHGDTIKAEEETTDADDGQIGSLESFQPIVSSSHDEGSMKEVLQEATSDHKNGKTIDEELLENLSSNEAQTKKDSTDTLLLSPKFADQPKEFAANEEIFVEDMQKNVEESNSTDNDVVPEQCSKGSSVVASEIDDLKMDTAEVMTQLSKEMNSDHHGSNVFSTDNVSLTEEILQPQEIDPLSKVIESNAPCIAEGGELSDQVKKADGKSADEKLTEEDTSCDLTNEVSKEVESKQNNMVSEESVQKGLENEISVEDNLNTGAEEVYQENSTSGEMITTPETSNTDEPQTKSVLNLSLSKEEETNVHESERSVTTSESYGVPSEKTLSESHGDVVCPSKTLEDFATDHSDLNLAENSEKSSIVQIEDSQIERDEHLEEESERLSVTEVSTRGANDNVPLVMGTVKDKDEELKEAELSENEQITRCTLVKEDVEIENPAESSHVALENMEVSNLSQDNQSKFLSEEQSTNATPDGNLIEAEEATVDAAEPQKDCHENLPSDEAYGEVNNSSPNVSKDAEKTDQTENDGTDTLLVSLMLADQQKEFAANEEKSAEDITKNVEEPDRTEEVVPEKCSKDSSAVTSDIDDPEVVTQLPIDTSSDHIGSNDSSIKNAARTEDELQRTDLTCEESESNLPCAPERDELIVQVKTMDGKSADEKPAEEDTTCDLTDEVSKERESDQNRMTLEHEELENKRSVEDNDDVPAATDDVKYENEACKEAALSENEQTTRSALVKEDAKIEKPAETSQVALENIEASNLSQENKSEVLPEEQSTNEILHGNTIEAEEATNGAADLQEETLEPVATETKHEQIEENLASQVDYTERELEEHLEMDTQNSSLTEAKEETDATESKNTEETIKPGLENTESMSMNEETDLEKTSDSLQVQPDDIKQDDSSTDMSNSTKEPISNTDSREISTDGVERESVDASHTNEGSIEIKDVARDIPDCVKEDRIQIEEVGSQNPFSEASVKNANDDESTKIIEACLIKEEESLESLQAEAQDIDQNKMTLEQEGLENNRSVEENFNTAAGEISHENSTSGVTVASLETSENDELPSKSDSNPSLSKKEATDIQDENPSAAELFENDKITESVLLTEEVVQCERPVESLHAALEDVKTSDFDQHTEATGIFEEQIPAEKSQGIPSDETEGTTTFAANANEITRELQNVTNEDNGKDLSVEVNASEIKHDTNLEEEPERPSVIEASNEECLGKVESQNNKKESLQPEDHTTSTSNADMETTRSLDGQSLTENSQTSISEETADAANETELALESIATESTHGQVEENLVNQVDCADREQEEHLEKDNQNSSLTEALEETDVTESKYIELNNRGEDSTKPELENEENAYYTGVKEETNEKPIDCDEEDSIKVEEVDMQNQLNEASTETANDDESTKITESYLIKAEESLESLRVEARDTETHCLRRDSETCSPDEQSPLANSERIMDGNKEEIANNVTGVECESPKDKQNIANTTLHEDMKENLQVQEDCSQQEENEVMGCQSENIPSSEAPAVPSTEEEEKVETPIKDQILTADPQETCNEVDGLQKPSSEEFPAEKTTDPAGEETQEDQDTAKSAPHEDDSPNEQNTEATLIKEDVSIELPQVAAEDTKEPCLAEVRETNSQEEHHGVLINDKEENKTIDPTVFQKEAHDDEVLKEMESIDGKAATKEEEEYLEGVQTATAVNIVAFHQEKSSSLTAEETPSAEDNNVIKDVIGHIPEVSNYKQEESSLTEISEEHTVTSNEPGSASMESEVPEHNNDQVVGEANNCRVKTDSKKMEELNDGSIAVPTGETLKKLDPRGCTETEVQVSNGEKEAEVIKQETEDDEKTMKETLPSYASEDISESRELNGEEEIDSNNCKEISSEEVPTSDVALEEDSTSISPQEPKSERREEAETEEDQKRESAPEVSQLVQNSSVEFVERDVQLYIVSATANDSGITGEMEKIKKMPLLAPEESIIETTGCKESDVVEGATKNDDAAPEIKETTLSSAEGQDAESESVEETSNCIETKNDDEAPENKETILSSAEGQDAKNASNEETSNCAGSLTEKKLDSNEIPITAIENKSGYSSNYEGLESIAQVQRSDVISQIQFDEAVTENTLQEETISEKETMKDNVSREKEQSTRIKKEDEEITEYHQRSCEDEVITATHQEDEVNREQQINSNETDEYAKNENETETVATVSEELDNKAPKDIQEKEVPNEAIERILHQQEQVTSIEEHTTSEKAHEMETACLKTDTQDTNKEGVQLANISARETEETNRKDDICSSDEVQAKDEDKSMLSEGKSGEEAKETYKAACVEAEKLDFASDTKGISECAISDGASDIPENNQNSTTQNKFPGEDIALTEQSSEDTINAAEVQEAKAGLDLVDAVPEATRLESREVEEFHDKCAEVADKSEQVENPVVLTSTIKPEHTERTPLEAEDQQTKLHGMPEELNIKGSEVKMAERELCKESFEKLTNEPVKEIPEEKMETSVGQETEPIQSAPVSETRGAEIEKEQLGRNTNIPNQLGSSCDAENEKVPESDICQSSVEDTDKHDKREGIIDSSLFLAHTQCSDIKASETDLPEHVGGLSSIDVKEPEASSLSLADKHVVLNTDDIRNLNAESLDGDKNISTELSQGEHKIVKPSKVEQEEDKCGHEERTEQEMERKPELEETNKPSLSDLLQVSTTTRQTSQMADHSPTEKEPSRHTEDRHAENTDEAEHENSKTDEEKDEDEESYEQGKSDLSSEAPVMVDMGDADMKVTPKKSHNILSGVGSKMKHSIAKVKKAITGKSSHPKTPSPKKAINAETK